MAFHRRCEALLETGVGSTVVDVVLNGVTHGLGHAYAVDLSDQFQSVGLLSQESKGHGELEGNITTSNRLWRALRFDQSLRRTSEGSIPQILARLRSIGST